MLVLDVVQLRTDLAIVERGARARAPDRDAADHDLRLEAHGPRWRCASQTRAQTVLEEFLLEHFLVGGRLEVFLGADDVNCIGYVFGKANRFSILLLNATIFSSTHVTSIGVSSGGNVSDSRTFIANTKSKLLVAFPADLTSTPDDAIVGRKSCTSVGMDVRLVFVLKSKSAPARLAETGN